MGSSNCFLFSDRDYLSFTIYRLQTPPYLYYHFNRLFCVLHESNGYLEIVVTCVERLCALRRYKPFEVHFMG